jgi:hypothetical protein
MAAIEDGRSSGAITIRRAVGEPSPPTPPLHLLPCKIGCTCDKEENKACKHPAKVDTFFEPVIRKTSEKESGVGRLGDGYSATFRGRPLRGVVMDVADGYTGEVLRNCCKSGGNMQLKEVWECVCVHCVVITSC